MRTVRRIVQCCWRAYTASATHVCQQSQLTLIILLCPVCALTSQRDSATGMHQLTALTQAYPAIRHLFVTFVKNQEYVGRS